MNIKKTYQGNPILITGVSQRLGYYCALELAKAGNLVLGTYRDFQKNQENLEQLKDAGVELIQAELATESGISSFIDEVKSQYSSLRCIIHNASSWSKDMPDEAQSKQHGLAQTLFNVHAIAPYQINLALAPLLMQETPSDIIHVTDYVVNAGSDHHIAYAASKAALENMTKSFARRFAPQIKVNSIAPSLIMFNQKDDPAYREKALAKSLLGIEPGPEVFLQSIQYLMDNPYLTGQTIQLEGGRSIRQS